MTTQQPYNSEFLKPEALPDDFHSVKILLLSPPLEKIIEPVYDHPGFVRTSLALLAAILRKGRSAVFVAARARTSARFWRARVEFRPGPRFAGQVVCELHLHLAAGRAGSMADRLRQGRKCLRLRKTLIPGAHGQSAAVE